MITDTNGRLPLYDSRNIYLLALSEARAFFQCVLISVIIFLGPRRDAQNVVLHADVEIVPF